MYFPNDMTFQYFFFDTYIGYFLQALPIALFVSTTYGVVRFWKKREVPLCRKIFSCMFVCYITGLICLVIGLNLMQMFWYALFYNMDSGIEINFFSGEYDLIPDFFNHISGEVIGNFLMFLPFGILYPLSQAKPTWKKTAVVGFLTVIIIEVFQPVFGRAFDMNDVIINTVAIFMSALIFFSYQKMSNR